MILKHKIILVLAILLFIFPFISGCVGERGRAGSAGTPGAMGPPGAGNMTMNMTQNMTVGPTGPTGPIGPQGPDTSATWNTSYYLRDTSRSLTGANVRRDVNNDLLYLWGGDSGNPQGGQIQLYGGANPGLDGGMAFAVGDAAGNFHPVMWIEGTTDTPHLTMISHQIKELLDPTAAQDAATKHYVDDAVSGGTTAQLNDYFKNDTSKLLYGSDLKRDVDNSYIAMYGGNAIAGGTGIIAAYGKDHPGTNEAEIIVGDAAGVGNIVVSGWRGGAAPLLDMNSYNITGIMTITNATDATNKSYVDIAIAGVSGGSTNLSAVYPIGSVYISTFSTDPKITFEGFGCWTSIGTGYVIIGG